MAIVSMYDVVGYYNSVIKSFMDQGYVISPTTMNGGYTHVDGYTDLINPRNKKSIIKVFVVNNFRSVENYFCTTIKVMARKYNWNGRFTSSNFWLDDGDLISEKIFFQIKEHLAFADNIDDLTRIIDLRRQRRNTNTTIEKKKKLVSINRLSGDCIDSIMEKINRIHGFKRATASCIEEIYSYMSDNGFDRPRLKGEVIFSFNNRSGRIKLS